MCKFIIIIIIIIIIIKYSHCILQYSSIIAILKCII